MGDLCYNIRTRKAKGAGIKMRKSSIGKYSTARDLATVALAIALLAVCSYIAIPTPKGHITLQLFAVLLIASVLDFKKSVLAVALYVLMGLIGLPVFAGFRGGFSVLFEISGGFLAAFILMSAIIPLSRRFFGNSTRCILISSVCSILLSYLIATIWIHAVSGGIEHPSSFPIYLLLYTAVFIIPDLLKLALVIYIAPKIRKFTDFSRNEQVSS